MAQQWVDVHILITISGCQGFTWWTPNQDSNSGVGKNRGLLIDTELHNVRQVNVHETDILPRRAGILSWKTVQCNISRKHKEVRSKDNQRAG